MKKNALILFAKTPIPSFSKTRLIDPFTAEQAAAFSSASLVDVFNTLHASSDFDLHLAIAPERFDKNHFPIEINSGKYFFQQGSDLGMRMRKAFQFISGSGYDKIIILGSDFPHIPEKIIGLAFDNLNNYDCVIGPAIDGGYYLIGLNKMYDFLFEGIDWSTDKVYNQTVEKAKRHNIKIKNLERHYDVDTVKDIKQLYFDLKKMDKSQKNFPLNVWHFLQTNKNIFL